MKIKLICVGKIKEDYITSAINEYKKRLSAFCELVIIEEKEINLYDDFKNILLEGEEILKDITKDDFLVTLEIKGKQLSSEELSIFVKEHYTYSNRPLVFVIGGSCGLSEDVIKRSDYHLSFSKMTFPHQLMRVIFLEQLYRVMMINSNKKYHK